MGLFDWIFGKPKQSTSESAPATQPHAAASAHEAIPPSQPKTVTAEPPPTPPTPAAAAQKPRLGAPFDRSAPPKVIGGLDDHSLQVWLDSGDGMVTVMDRDMYDYIYGNIQAPDPAQRDLDELLPTITRVDVVASGLGRGRAIGKEIVIDTDDPQALAELRTALRIVEDPYTFSHCACLGGPTLRLFTPDKLVAQIGLQHGHSIRWPHWKHDARLTNGELLNDWLKRHGFEDEFLDTLLHNQYEAGGMRSIGVVRYGSAPLTQTEQRLRLAELSRTNGGDRHEALTEVQAIIDAGNPPPYAYLVRGLFRNDAGDLPGAVADFDEVIRLGLHDPETYFARGVARSNLRLFDEALADCSEALKIEPDHYNALHSRGIINMQSGRPDEALADFAAVMRLQPEWHLPYQNRAQLHHMLGNFDAAISDYSRVVEMIGNSRNSDDVRMTAMLLWNRGKCYEQKGLKEKAEADFTEARRRMPEIGRGK